MLGIDFLVENKANWDFEKSVLWLDDKPFYLQSRPDRHHWCRRVVLQETVTVPARSEAVVPTQVQFHRLPVTEPVHLQHGLHVSRTLIPKGTWTDVPVRIMNVEKRPLPLKPGTVIADLQ